MFPVKQAKRSALADVSCKTSEALFAKQKCFFKFKKKRIFDKFRFLFSALCFPIGKKLTLFV